MAVVFFTALTVSAVAHGQVPQPIVGTAAPTAMVEQAPQHDARFEFHSSFWLNLHLRLYEEARRRDGLAVTLGGGAATPAPPIAPPSNPAERKQWDAAVNYYAATLAHRDLLFDNTLPAITDKLALLEDCPDLSDRAGPHCVSGLQPELLAALEAAAPVYHSREWPEQDRHNRLWVANVAPLVRDLSPTLSKKISRVYESDWPSAPIRVDVAGYAGPLGAYTTLDPARITVSSEDPRNDELPGLEVLFHEASHLLAGKVQEQIARECNQQKKPIPRDLWHALIFYTTGVLVQQALESTGPPISGGGGVPAYIPYAQRNALYEPDWQSYEKLLRAYWQPYLDGKVDFQRAITTLVDGL
jgi:hypothetical protein